MKILLVHNYYGSSAPSGENKVFEAEKAMLEKHGHEVAVYTRHSDEIRGTGKISPERSERRRRLNAGWEWGTVSRIWGIVKGALCTVGNPFAARAVAKKCREFKPDVVHFHNTFPLISPLAVRTARTGEVAAKVGVEVNPYVIAPEEFRWRVSAGDHFLGEVMVSPKIFLKGDENELAELA